MNKTHRSSLSLYYKKMLIGEIELNHIPTSDQVVNISTKPLGKQKKFLFREALGLCSL
jgi:hypothetical protein